MGAEKEKHGSCSPNEALDLLVGAEAIAKFMFDDPDGARRVYHAFEAHDLPAFKVGKALWARKRALMRWVEEKETQLGAEYDPPPPAR